MSAPTEALAELDQIIRQAKTAIGAELDAIAVEAQLRRTPGALHPEPDAEFRGRIITALMIARAQALEGYAEYILHLETYLAGMGRLEHFKQTWAEGQAMKNGRQSKP